MKPLNNSSSIRQLSEQIFINCHIGTEDLRSIHDETGDRGRVTHGGEMTENVRK